MNILPSAEGMRPMSRFQLVERESCYRKSSRHSESVLSEHIRWRRGTASHAERWTAGTGRWQAHRSTGRKLQVLLCSSSAPGPASPERLPPSLVSRGACFLDQVAEDLVVVFNFCEGLNWASPFAQEDTKQAALSLMANSSDALPYAVVFAAALAL